MSTNVHGHQVWGKNSHVSEKMVQQGPIPYYAVHVAVMRRDTVVARKNSAACSLFLHRNGTIRGV